MESPVKYIKDPLTLAKAHAKITNTQLIYI